MRLTESAGFVSVPAQCFKAGHNTALTGECVHSYAWRDAVSINKLLYERKW